ncbi:phosphotransferase [Legionella bononiensis]|uniref:Aminoglycoside phosphotransferase family protein n=1 Tax=Legionella bononiensis TaxID=2793102 RepID=A0ABS1W8B2_9GAMM|nr:phosphotransferase [Legionella bononiensis]MBL7479877.1 aminoglycoside phosphotransferase family protein [Legionella bononiensis]MBL7525608.1 aminoglycoside phosphotransferase family protein [Legionella bononiensis]MBL7561791.1 aminoglycoside phosphotransferase family protein [Legionella bononiensis]
MSKKPIQEQEIIQLLKIYYGINAQSAQLISGGADFNAFAYKSDAKDNSNSYFVKFKYGDHDDIGLSIISILHDSGIKELIVPINTLEGKSSQLSDRFRIIVYPFIHAPNGFTQNLTEKQWKQLGTALRSTHEITVPALIQNQLRKESYSTQWREMVRSFYSRIEPDSSDDKITADFKAFFKQNSAQIHRLVDSTEELSKKIHPDPEHYVLCHSDVHAGNILVANDDSIYIIDWDEPMMGPKERDLMFIGGGVGHVWNKHQEIEYFYEGYGTTDIDKTMLSYYRHERIVEDLALYGADLLAQDQSDESRMEMLQYFIEMFNPNDVIEIAFATKPI